MYSLYDDATLRFENWLNYLAYLEARLAPILSSFNAIRKALSKEPTKKKIGKLSKDFCQIYPDWENLVKEVDIASVDLLNSIPLQSDEDYVKAEKKFKNVKKQILAYADVETDISILLPKAIQTSTPLM